MEETPGKEEKPIEPQIMGEALLERQPLASYRIASLKTHTTDTLTIQNITIGR